MNLSISGDMVSAAGGNYTQLSISGSHVFSFVNDTLIQFYIIFEETELII